MYSGILSLVSSSNIHVCRNTCISKVLIEQYISKAFKMLLKILEFKDERVEAVCTV